MASATFRFYAELNDFLAPERRQRDWPIEFAAPAPVRHLIERCGVPHTEVELIVRGGESIDLETPVGHGERVAVYPIFEAFDVGSLLQLRQRPLRVPRFLADAHLGTLAKRLRMLGFDTLFYNDLGDAALAELAAREHRILLTRDRQLLMRRSVTHGCYLRAKAPGAQLTYLVERLQLCTAMAPFSRCIVCNGGLDSAASESVRAAVPPRVWSARRDYWRCRECARVYWKGSHWAAMSRQIAGLCREFGGGAGAVP